MYRTLRDFGVVKVDSSEGMIEPPIGEGELASLS